MRKLRSTITKRFLTSLTLVAAVTLVAGTAVGQTADPRGSDTFDDVPVGHWADEEIGWAVANDITVGVGEGRFGLNDVVTRAQILTFLYRTVTLLQGAPAGGGVASDVFEDVPSGHWADEEIGWALANGIVAGVSDDRFDLNGTVSRAEIVTFIHRTVNLIQGKPVTTPTGPGAIVFHNEQDGDVEIYAVNADRTVVNADGTNVRQLTNNSSHDQYPSWSPDGTQIAFESYRGSGWQIFVMNADGTNEQQLTEHLSNQFRPSWSPDGTQIAFESDRDGDLEIFVINADGTNEQQLTNNTHHDWSRSWSPDGTQIAFESDRDGDLEIFVINADGTNEQQLTDNSFFDQYPSWSPDGTQIAFISDRGRGRQVFVVNADGTNEQRLTEHLSNQFRPSWSPDGTQIAFISDRDGDLEIFVINADGTNEQRLTEHLSNQFRPSWSPDGTQIAFISDRDGDLEIFVINADGTNEQQLTNNTHDDVVTLQAWSSRTFGGGADFFDDVPVGHEADRAIGWAFLNGITSGVGEGRFDPDGTVNRAQIVTFLYRIVDLIQTSR